MRRFGDLNECEYARGEARRGGREDEVKRAEAGWKIIEKQEEASRESESAVCSAGF